MFIYLHKLRWFNIESINTFRRNVLGSFRSRIRRKMNHKITNDTRLDQIPIIFVRGSYYNVGFTIVGFLLDFYFFPIGARWDFPKPYKNTFLPFRAVSSRIWLTIFWKIGVTTIKLYIHAIWHQKVKKFMKKVFRCVQINFHSTWRSYKVSRMGLKLLFIRQYNKSYNIEKLFCNMMIKSNSP